MKKKIIIFACISVTGLVLAIFIFGGVVASRDQRFYKLCVAGIKNGLISPSSYKLRDRSQLVVSKATFEEYLGWDDTEKRNREEAEIKIIESSKSLYQSKKRHFEYTPYTYYVIYLEYEAANSFGASIDQFARCRAVLNSKEDMANLLISGDAEVEIVSESSLIRMFFKF